MKNFIQYFLIIIIINAFLPGFWDKYSFIILQLLLFFSWFPDYKKVRRGVFNEDIKQHYLVEYSVKEENLEEYLKGIRNLQAILILNILINYIVNTIIELPKVLDTIWLIIIYSIPIINLYILRKKCSRD